MNTKPIILEVSQILSPYNSLKGKLPINNTAAMIPVPLKAFFLTTQLPSIIM